MSITLDDIDRCCAVLNVSTHYELFKMAYPWGTSRCLSQLVYDTLGGLGPLTDALNVLDDVGTTETRLRSVLTCGPTDLCYELYNYDALYGFTNVHYSDAIYGSRVGIYELVPKRRCVLVGERNGCPVLTFGTDMGRSVDSAATITFRRPAPGPLRLDVERERNGRSRMVISLRDGTGPWLWRFPGGPVTERIDRPRPVGESF